MNVIYFFNSLWSIPCIRENKILVKLQGISDKKEGVATGETTEALSYIMNYILLPHMFFLKR